MNPAQRIAQLEELERKERLGQRKAAQRAWMSVALAALTMAVLIAASYYELSRIQREVSDLERRKRDLEKVLWQIDAPSAEALPKPSTAPPKQAPAVSAQKGEAPAPPPPGAGAPAPGRIYMHIAEQADREFANRMAQALSGRDFLVVGTEHVPGAKTASTTEVRYYKEADAGAARQIAAILSENGAAGAHISYLQRYEQSTTVRPGVFEVWFPPNVR